MQGLANQGGGVGPVVEGPRPIEEGVQGGDPSEVEPVVRIIAS